ncbi:MAG: radical SAM protein [Sedimentisphaerales bacterium]|nr:radical SAM protein [Sedimentisphaerales bacterium]
MTKTTGPKQMLRLLFWESTIKCNLSCAHCRRIESEETSNKDLTTTQAMNLIEQLAEMGKQQSFMPILVFSGGEPLCRDDLFELIKRAKKTGIIPALATNGTLINSSIAEKISDSDVMRVSVSLDGATAEIHDGLRRQKGSFEKALEGIGHLRDKKVPFQINITLTKQNAHQIEDIYNLAMSLGAVAVHIFMLVPVGCGRSLADTDMLSPEQYEQKMLEIYKLDSRGEIQMKVTCGPHYERIVRQKNTSPDMETKHGNHGGNSKGCLAGLGVLFVGHQGHVFPCGYLPVKCGNILEVKLSDIWFENKDLARMRDGNQLEGKCGVCGYRHICGGCRGRAYSATGNYMAEEPFCAYVPPEAVRCRR